MLDQLIEKVKQEFEIYRALKIQRFSSEVFDQAGEIYAIHEIYYYIAENQDIEFLLPEDQVNYLARLEDPLMVLYRYYVDTDCFSVSNWENIQDLISSFCE